MQHIGEGQLDIPDQWHNLSVNIFTAKSPGTPGLSVTVNREALPFQTTLDDYVAQQSGKLAKQLNGFALIDQAQLEVDGHPAHQLEFSWQADDSGPVHQVLLCVAHGPTALNLTASHGGRMSEPQLLEAKRILQSLRFATAENPLTDGAAAEANADKPTLQ
jgi:hypothetical protein